LGVSTCHGNADPKYTHANAVRLLHAFHAPIDVHAHRGAVKPLLRPARTDPEIHGDDGLGGVDGLPTLEDPGVLERWQLDGRRLAVDGMAKALKSALFRFVTIAHRHFLHCTVPETLSLTVIKYVSQRRGL
jgi:uridine nucleosidase